MKFGVFYTLIGDKPGEIAVFKVETLILDEANSKKFTHPVVYIIEIKFTNQCK